MKLSPAAMASAVLLSVGVANAFGPPASLTQQQQYRGRTTTTRLDLLPVDPTFAASAAESTSSIISDAGLFDSLGSLALVGSVGFGVAFGNRENKDWSYEYKVGNELSEGGTLGGKGGSATADKPVVTEAQKSFFGGTETAAKAAAVAPASAPAPPPPAPAKVSKPSKKILQSAEIAKAEVKKVGVQETKAKLSSKIATLPPPAPTPAPVKVASASTEVAESKKPGAKRRFAKGVALLLAAGGVAVIRNVVKAYLGRGMV
mmetsp:Transcript_24293/g.52043  ORF Transcript_24293/g.52043 Transcript_24293/m.52043 type:complete len:260 (-) Transcript_24293:380-1159(-)